MYTSIKQQLFSISLYRNVFRCNFFISVETDYNKNNIIVTLSLICIYIYIHVYETHFLCCTYVNVI